MERLFLLFVLLFQTYASATLFDDLNRAFDKGNTPKIIQARGYNSGYCVHYNMPFRALASVYVYKEVRNSNFLPYPYDSQTYFINQNVPVNHYKFFTPIDVERDRDLRYWFDYYEVWEPSHFSYGSIASHFRHPQFDTTRMVRTYKNNNGRVDLVLKIVPFNSPFSAPYTLCYYPDYLGSLTPTPTPVPTPTPTPTPSPLPSPVPVTPIPVTAVPTFTIGHTGKITGEKEVELKLESARVTNTLIFTHSGTQAINLLNVNVELPNANLLLAETITLKPNEPFEISLGSYGEEIYSISFNVKGDSENIEVKGVIQ